jgi:hypothetical protein
MGSRKDSMQTREIIIPHDPRRGPLLAVRRMLIHSSIAQLQELGAYERYGAEIGPTALASIQDMIGPGWLPAELALKHYEACDKLGFTDKQIQTLGERAGENLGNALLVAGVQVPEPRTEESIWMMVRAFSRMGRRIQEGASAQYVKLGRSELLIEHTANPLFSSSYYRVGHLGFLRKTFEKLGLPLSELKGSPYRKHEAEFDVRLRWK